MPKLIYIFQGKKAISIMSLHCLKFLYFFSEISTTFFANTSWYKTEHRLCLPAGTKNTYLGTESLPKRPRENPYKKGIKQFSSTLCRFDDHIIGWRHSIISAPTSSVFSSSPSHHQNQSSFLTFKRKATFFSWFAQK